MSGRISSAMVSSIFARASSASVNRSSKVISCPVRRSILTAAHSCVARSVSSAPLERIATLRTSSASAAEYVTVSGTGEDISTAIRLNRFSIFPACKIASFTCCWMLSSAIPVISGYLTLLLPSVSPFSVICGTFSIASGAAGAFVACGTSTGVNSARHGAADSAAASRNAAIRALRFMGKKPPCVTVSRRER